MASRLFRAVSQHRLSGFDVQDSLSVLACIHPEASLNGFETAVGEHDRHRFVRASFDDDWCPVSNVETKYLIEWAALAPTTRFRLLATSVRIFRRPDSNGAVTLSQQFLGLLDAAPDKAGFIVEASLAFWPSGGWSGSIVNIMEGRRKALTVLLDHSSAEVRAAIPELLDRLSEAISAEREWEAKRERERTERFE